ncbi:MAG: DNA cytosine methyltransferase, partial [Pyrinomonadaceae bacterium]
ENVKGLWKTKKHREFYEEIKLQLEAAGYRTVERLINAIEYGAPQDRERVILIGFRSKSSIRPIDVSSFNWVEKVDYPERVAFSYDWAETSEFVQDSEIALPVGIPIKLTVEYWFRKNDVETHPNSKHYFQPRAGLARFLTVLEGDVTKKSSKRLHRWRYSPTAAYGNNEVHLHPYKARRLSVAEALSIQSLPKEFELPPYMTLSNMFKCVGNGVPFLAARGLAISLKKFLENEIHETNSNGHRTSNKSIAAQSGIQLY